MSHLTLIEITEEDVQTIADTRVVYNQAPIILSKFINYVTDVALEQFLRDNLVGKTKSNLPFSKDSWTVSDLPELIEANREFFKETFIDELREGLYSEYLDNTMIDNTLLAHKYKHLLYKAREITNISNFSTINPNDTRYRKITIDYTQKNALDKILTDQFLIYDLLEYCKGVVEDVS